MALLRGRDPVEGNRVAGTRMQRRRHMFLRSDRPGVSIRSVAPRGQAQSWQLAGRVVEDISANDRLASLLPDRVV